MGQFWLFLAILASRHNELFGKQLIGWRELPIKVGNHGLAGLSNGRVGV